MGRPAGRRRLTHLQLSLGVLVYGERLGCHGVHCSCCTHWGILERRDRQVAHLHNTHSGIIRAGGGRAGRLQPVICWDTATAHAPFCLGCTVSVDWSANKLVFHKINLKYFCAIQQCQNSIGNAKNQTVNNTTHRRNECRLFLILSFFFSFFKFFYL